MRGKILTVEERDEILRGICESLSDHSIATGLGRNQSVISREITRNERPGRLPGARRTTTVRDAEIPAEKTETKGQ